MSNDISKIKDIPNIPDELRKAYENKTLVVFIGAGVSRIIGTKGWDELANRLINACYANKKKDSKETCINFKEKETLEKERNNKKLITICHDILKRNNLVEKFYDEFNDSLDAIDELRDKYNIYDELLKLNAIYISTNADEHFDNKFEKENRLFKKGDFIHKNIRNLKLFKIHGSKEDRESLIFTVPKYIKRYNDEKFIKFLEQIFGNRNEQSKYTVLFVGYGMEEFEIIDFLITKFDKNNKSEEHEIKHFILLPFYSGEENILDFENSYYNPMGIQVLGYTKDKNGYNQLYNVITDWNKKLREITTVVFDDLNEIDTLLGE